MKNLNNFIIEKLKIGKNMDSMDYDDIYGSGQVMQFKMCYPPVKGILEPHEIDHLLDTLHKYIGNYDLVYFIQDQANTLSKCKNVSDKFKEELRKCKVSDTKTIYDYGPDVNVQILTLKNYNNIPETTVIRCQNWKEDVPITHWYIKL